jgi:adenine phosphoribosyltransferase
MRGLFARPWTAGQPYSGGKVDKVAGIEARGFILGGAVAHQLSAGFVPIRKKGKLPHETVGSPIRWNTALTRWRCTRTPFEPGETVILVDDLIATGGTAEAAVKLLQEIGADVVAACFIIDLPALGDARRSRRSMCRCAP